MNLRMIFPGNATPMDFEADPQEFYEAFLYDDNGVQIYVVENDVETYLPDWIAKKHAGKVIRMKNIQPCALWNNFSWDANFTASVIFADGRRQDLESWVNECEGLCTDQDTFDVELVMTPPSAKKAPVTEPAPIFFDTPGSSTWEQTLKNNFTDREIAAIQTNTIASLRPKGGWGSRYAPVPVPAPVPAPIPAEADKSFAELPRGTKLRAYIDGALVGKARKQDDRVFLYERNSMAFGCAGRYMSYGNFRNNFGVSSSKLVVRTDDGLEVAE